MSAAAPLLVGYDGREESEIALDQALSEAHARGTNLVVVVVGGIPVVAADPLDPTGMGMGMGVFPEMTPDGPVDIQPIMAAARRKLAASGVKGHVEWSLGDPAAEILRVADEHDAAVIIVGTHRHSAISRLVGDDVAGTVMRRAHCDVVIAR
jgi:nucleotide-binding universal stress UspA family protein